MSSITPLLEKLILRDSLSRNEAREVMESLMTGMASPAQAAGLLVALRMKGETIDEVAGFADGMRHHLLPVKVNLSPLVDTCGTGGSRERVFNVSTAAAFVAASAGIAVAKHGNRAMSGVCGSADVLEALGAKIDLTAEQISKCIEKTGIGFLFAQAHHPATKNIAPIRRELGVRTIFNLLGPLSNPAGATRQAMGVYAPELVPLAAGALKSLGSEIALVFHGKEGLDEISTTGPTLVAELRDGTIIEYQLTPEHFGISPATDPTWLLPRDTPLANAQILHEALDPTVIDAQTLARRDLVAVNAGAVLYVSDKVVDLVTGYTTAIELIMTRSALRKLDEFVIATQGIE